MKIPGRPHRLSGWSYRGVGPVYHCRFATFDRAPTLAAAGTASIVLGALEFYHGRSVRVLAYCVMPDHVHVLVSLIGDALLPRWLGDIKRWTTSQARQRTGVQLRWQPNFYEHVVRSDEDVVELARYILANPVRAGLVASVGEFPFSGSFEWDFKDQE